MTEILDIIEQKYPENLTYKKGDFISPKKTL